MIKDLFLPTRIGHTYLFPQDMVAFELGDDAIRATKIHAHRSLATLSAYIEEPCVPSKPESVLHALMAIKERLGKWDVTHICLPSNRAVFKRLSLPFTNKAKIRLVLPFELEPVLPFPVDQAVFDVLLKPSEEQSDQSDVFVATIKREVLEGYVKPFIDLGITPQRVTFGGIELYGLINTVEAGHVHQGLTVAMNVDTATTDVLFIMDGHLLGMRTLSRGIDANLLQRSIASFSPDEQGDLKRLIDDLKFTIQAFVKSEQLTNMAFRLLLSGSACAMEEFVSLLGQELGTPVSTLHPHDVMRMAWVNMDHQGVLPDKFIKSLATALPRSITEYFDIGAAYHDAQDLRSFKIKFFVSTGFVAILLGVVIVSTMLSTGALRRELTASRAELEKQLVTEFKLTKKPGLSGVKGLLDEAQKRLSVNEGVWSALTTDRYSFLTYLQQLSTHINRNEIGLELKKLAIKRDPLTGEDRLSLEGSVKDWEALRTLQTALQDTKLFKNIPRMEDTKFTLSLTVNKEGDFR